MSWFNKNNYRKSIHNDGWKYREFGTTIIGLHDVLGIRQLSFPNYKTCHVEFKKLTGKQAGRPKDADKTVAHKGDAI